MKRDNLLFGALAIAAVAFAEAPSGYYKSLEGLSGNDLAAAVAKLAAGHTRVTYSTKTWPAFEVTDVIEVEGREAWRDMYSNNLVFLPGHDALNIEHSVANSWWGGKSGSADAYADLFHLNPSDQNANNKKGNYPPGLVATPDLLDNGVFKVGKPQAGYGGDAGNVFEPADQYKGDFARAYFYVFATYPEIPWKEEYSYIFDLTGGEAKLKPWASEMLLAWHHADPVDSREMARNEAVEGFQKNRNPFIDIPELADCLWGEGGKLTGVSGAVRSLIVNRPEAPVFDNSWLTALNTYSRRFWNGFSQDLTVDEGALWVSIDGSDYARCGTTLDIEPAYSEQLNPITVKAYTEAETDGYTLRSAVSTLTLTPLNPDEKDYSVARWEKVTTTAGIPGSSSFGIILSANTQHVMSTSGGTTATAFMNEAGFVEFTDELVTQLPVTAAIVRFTPRGGKHIIGVYDTHANLLGYWLNTADKKMKLDPESGTPATLEIDASGNFTATFEEYGKLQFNKSQPRFLNYTTTQGGVELYGFRDFNSQVGIDLPEAEETEPIGISGGDIIAPEGMTVYDLNGRPVEGRGLRPGIYVVAGNGRAVKVIVCR